jgi:N-acetylglucosaminyl-diphospho-decaprenol L-rhamnosyltransferase
MNRPTGVVVHYGPTEPTLRLLAALRSVDVDLVVVANDLRPRPSGVDDDVEWLVPSRNLGYGEAFMLAARSLRAPAYVVLNTDIELSRETFDRCLEALFSAPDVGIAGPVLRHEDGSLQSGAARLSRWRRAPRVLVEPGPRTVACDWVTGAVMFVRREVVAAVGMDGSFFLGAEDADLCVRARRAGWRVVCCGDAPAVHHGSKVITGPRWTYYSMRNRVWFARANFGMVAAVLNWLAGAAVLPRVVLADVLKRRDLTSCRLGVMALAHSWWRKPTAQEGPRPDEPIPNRVMTW